jgi:hypothetical protein
VGRDGREVDGPSALFYLTRGASWIQTSLSSVFFSCLEEKSLLLRIKLVAMSESPDFEIQSLRCHPESPVCKDRSLRLPGAKALESPVSPFKDSGGATQTCTTWVKNRVWETGFFGRSLRLWSSESPPRKSPTTGLLQGFSQPYWKGV